jgi:hypothetical protein
MGAIMWQYGGDIDWSIVNAIVNEML